MFIKNLNYSIVKFFCDATASKKRKMLLRVPAGPPAAGWAGAGWSWRTAPPGVCSRRGSRGWPGTGSSTVTSAGYTILSAWTGRYILVKRLHKLKSGGTMWFCFARKMLKLVRKNYVKNIGRNAGCLVIKTKAETKTDQSVRSSVRSSQILKF